MLQGTRLQHCNPLECALHRFQNVRTYWKVTPTSILKVNGVLNTSYPHLNTPPFSFIIIKNCFSDSSQYMHSPSVNVPHHFGNRPSTHKADPEKFSLAFTADMKLNPESFCTPPGSACLPRLSDCVKDSSFTVIYPAWPGPPPLLDETRLSQCLLLFRGITRLLAMESASQLHSC